MAWIITEDIFDGDVSESGILASNDANDVLRSKFVYKFVILDIDDEELYKGISSVKDCLEPLENIVAVYDTSAFNISYMDNESGKWYSV